MEWTSYVGLSGVPCVKKSRQIQPHPKQLKSVLDSNKLFSSRSLKILNMGESVQITSHSFRRVTQNKISLSLKREANGYKKVIIS